MPSPSLQDQAYMKLGRLIYSYQKFEKLLKMAVAQSTVSGTTKEIESILKKLHSATSGQTLGAIANRLFDTIYGPPAEEPDPDKVQLPHITMQIRRGCDDPDFLERERKKFQAVVEDRNKLIHCTLATFNFDSDVDCQRLIDELDRQLEQLRPLYKEIQDTLRAFTGMIQAVAANPSLLDHNADPPETIEMGDHSFTRDSR